MDKAGRHHKKLNIITACGIAAGLVFGPLLHFLYEWSGASVIAGLFGAVNESTWEHFKLLAVPMLLFTATGALTFARDIPSFVPSFALSIPAGMLFIAAAFYSYTAILGTHVLAADVAIFILSVFLCCLLARKLIQKGVFTSTAARLAGSSVLLLLAVLFIVFTFYPPRIFLFQDPADGSFGIPAP